MKEFNFDGLSAKELSDLQKTLRAKLNETREKETNEGVKEAEVLIDTFINDNKLVDEYVNLCEDIKSIVKNKKYYVTIPLQITIESNYHNNDVHGMLSDNFSLYAKVAPNSGFPKLLIQELNNHLEDIVPNACFDLSLIDKNLHEDYAIVTDKVKKFFSKFREVIYPESHNKNNQYISHAMALAKLIKKANKVMRDKKKPKKIVVAATPVKKKTKKK